MPIREERPRT